MRQWLERHQIALYLLALIGGAALGLSAPGLAGPAEVAVTPVLGALLYVTFLEVPLTRLKDSLRDVPFLLTIAAVNFLLVPIVVFALSRFVADEPALLVGVLFVLLAPCIDYVIVFTGLAGGAHERLLAATPLLMLGQMLLLPGYLRLFLGDGLRIDPGPFLEAFLLLILLPLVLAGLTQALAPARFRETVSAAMVPLMMLTLFTVLVSQIHGVSQHLGQLLRVVPIYVAFAAVMVPVGLLAARLARLDAPGARAVVFSGVTRNSLVILPLVLALPAGFELSPLVVVTQTLVELLIMVLFIRLIPRLVPRPSPTGGRAGAPRGANTSPPSPSD